MNIKEFNFKKRDRIIFCGWLFIAISIVFFLAIAFIFFSNEMDNYNIDAFGNTVNESFFGLLGDFLPFFIPAACMCALTIYAGFYLLTLHKRFYIKITETQLWIFNNLLSINRIALQSIESARLIGSKLFLILSENPRKKEAEILLDLLFVKDIETLLETLSLLNISVSRI